MSNMLSVTFKTTKHAPSNLTEKVYFVNTECKKDARDVAVVQLKYDLTLLCVDLKCTAEHLLNRYDVHSVIFKKIRVLKSR